MISPKEHWKDIPGYEGHYRVSSLGRVHSLPRLKRSKGGGFTRLHGRMLQPVLQKRFGYFAVTLTKDGRGRTHYIHLLVARAFVPNPANLPEVNHEDAVKANCAASNLTWTTHLGNIEHATKMGLMVRGFEHHSTKLNHAKVREIRKSTRGHRTEARAHGVSVQNVRNIRDGLIWRHVK